MLPLEINSRKAIKEDAKYTKVSCFVNLCKTLCNSVQNSFHKVSQRTTKLHKGSVRHSER